MGFKRKLINNIKYAYHRILRNYWLKQAEKHKYDNDDKYFNYCVKKFLFNLTRCYEIKI